MSPAHLSSVVIIGLLVLTIESAAAAQDGATLAAERCASCHNLAGPAPATFEVVLDRKAPDLFYAGSKFNRPWLVKWLQNPTVIRPAMISRPPTPRLATSGTIGTPRSLAP